MTTTRTYLELNDSQQIALTEMIRHFEKYCQELRDSGVEHSVSFVLEERAKEIMAMMDKNRSISSTSSFCD